jgi:hypothetical protein
MLMAESEGERVVGKAGGRARSSAATCSCVEGEGRDGLVRKRESERSTICTAERGPLRNRFVLIALRRPFHDWALATCRRLG